MTLRDDAVAFVSAWGSRKPVLHGPGQIRGAKIPPLEQDRVTIGLRAGVGQAVGEVELRRVSPTLAEAPERLDGHPADGVVDRHDGDPGLGQERIDILLNIDGVTIETVCQDDAGFQADQR